MISTHDFNNGKDIMRSDILIEKEDGKELYHAYLGFLPYRSLQRNAKFYMATGVTPELARLDLIDCIIDHLKRIR